MLQIPLPAAAFLSAFALASAAQAAPDNLRTQPTDSSALTVRDPEIVVTGEREQQATARAALFVKNMTRSSTNQLARFNEPLCPVVIGLPDASSVWIEQRIRRIAQEIGPGQAKDDCSANLLVIATDDVAKLFRDIRRERPRWLGSVSEQRRDALAQSKGPVVAWSATSLRNEDGEQVATRETVNHGGSGLDQFGKILRVKTASILRLPTQQYIDGYIVLLDREALLDRPTLQLADYIAVRGLTQADPTEDFGLETILSAFDPATQSKPEQITAADYAFIKSLYSGSGTRSASQARGRIAHAVAEFAF